jgi:hypothetical protein
VLTDLGQFGLALWRRGWFLAQAQGPSGQAGASGSWLDGRFEVDFTLVSLAVGAAVVAVLVFLVARLWPGRR